jgi:hypothetical protein
VSGHGLPFAHGRGHGNTVRLAVKDHYRVTGELTGSIDEESGITTRAVSVWISFAGDGASKRGVDGSTSVAAYVPARVCSGASGCTVVSTSVRVARSLCVRAVGGTKIVCTISAASAFLRTRDIVTVCPSVSVSFEVDAEPYSVGGQVIIALSR